MKSYNKFVFHLIFIFLAIFPFLIKPFGSFLNSTYTKFIYLTFFVLILWFIIAIQIVFKKHFPIHFKTLGLQVLVLFLLAVLLATMFSLDPELSFFGGRHKYIGFIAWFSFISLFLVSYFYIPIEKYKGLLKVLVIISAFVGLYGIIQHHFPQILYKREYGEFVRSWGFFDNSNHFASYIILMILPAMVFFLLAKKRWEKGLYLLTAGLLFASLLYTASRSGYLAVFIGWLFLGVYVIWKKRELWKRWAILSFTFLMIFIAVNLSENAHILHRLGSIGEDLVTVIAMEDNDGAGSYRWGIWKNTINIIGENWLNGSGPSTFRLVYPGLEETSILDNSHNEYLEIAYTIGAPGLILFVAFLLIVLLNGWKALSKLHGDEKLLQFGILLTIICYLIKMFFNIGVIPVAPYFYVFLGFYYHYSLMILKESEESKILLSKMVG